MPETNWLDEVERLFNVHVGGNPDGEPVVFVHGFGCDQNMWRFVVPAVASHHRTVLFDLPGCGRAAREAYSTVRHRTLDGYATDVLAVCDALDLRGATVVGHSVGATIALLAAIRSPSRIGRLVLVAPSPCFMNDLPDYRGGFERKDLEGLLALLDHNHVDWAATVAPMVMGNPGRPELTGELERSFCAMDPATAPAFARATFLADNRADLPQVRTPSLILQVRDDPLAPLDVGRYLERELAESELVVLDATGHCPHMSHPEITGAAIATWLERRSACA